MHRLFNAPNEFIWILSSKSMRFEYDILEIVLIAAIAVSIPNTSSMQAMYGAICSIFHENSFSVALIVIIIAVFR